MIDKIVEFFDECKQHSHHEHIKQPPAEFSGWRDDWRTRKAYDDWISKESNCASLRLQIEIPHEEILEEVLKIENRFIKHRGDIHPGWNSMCLHGVSTETTNDWRASEYDFETKPKMDWCDIADRCPITVDWLTNTFPYSSYDRVRFMLLNPGGWIKPHQDYDQRSLSSAVNIAISQPAGCDFAMEDAGIIPWRAGDIRAIDIGRPHCVWNNSFKKRIHMIIHGNGTPASSELMCKSYDHLIENDSIER